MEQKDPEVRTWFNYEIKKKFPEIVGGWWGITAEVPPDKVEQKPQKETRITPDEGLIIKHQMENLMHNALYAVGVKMGMFPDRRKEQKPIDFPDRRHSERNSQENNKNNN